MDNTRSDTLRRPFPYGRVPARPALRRPARPRAGSRRWGTLLHLSTIALILVFVGKAHTFVPGLGSLPLGEAAVLGMGLALALGGYLKRLPIVLNLPTVRLGLLLLGLGALSVPFALWPGGAASTLITVSKLFVLAILLPLAIVSPAELRTVTRTFAVAAAILVGGFALESLLGLSGPAGSQGGFDRNDVALFGVMGIPYALAWAAARRRSSRLLGFGIAGFLVAGVVATGSRGGFLALVAVGLIFLVRSKLLSPPKKVLLIAGAVSVAAVAGSDDFWQRISATFTNPTADYNFQAREGRIEIWKRGIGYAVEHPLTGVGIGNFPVAEGTELENLGYGVKWSTAHSAYILVVAELGFPGLLVFIGILGSIFREAGRAYAMKPRGRSPPEHPDAELAALGDATRTSFVGYVVGAAFLSMAYAVSLMFLVGVAASLHHLRQRSVAARRVALAARTGRYRRV